jgi:hypothetical protein
MELFWFLADAGVVVGIALGVALGVATARGPELGKKMPV